MSQEANFWARVLELAQKQIKKNTYDYFVSGARLMKVENFQATVLLDSPVKQLFWDQNLADVIITAPYTISFKRKMMKLLNQQIQIIQ